MTATAFLGSSLFAPAELEGVTAIALLGATLLIAGATHRRRATTKPPALAARAAAVTATAPSFFVVPAPVVLAAAPEEPVSATIIPFPGFGREPIPEGDSDVEMMAGMEAQLEAELAARAARICGRYINVFEGQHENQIA
jgi:hypothetical protein